MDVVPPEAAPVDQGSTLSPPTAPGTNPYSSSAAASARTSFTRIGVDTAQSQAHAEEDSDGLVAQEENIISSSQDRLPVEIETGSGPEPEANAIPQTPQICLTFLLVSGRRRTMAFEPRTTVGRVKELVWSGWSSGEWQDESERPPAPSYLRILHLGRILVDDETLEDLNFPTHTPSPAPPSPSAAPSATIVHLSIRSYVPPDDEDDLKKKKKKSKRRTNDASAGDNGAEGADDPPASGCCAGCVIC